MEKTMRNKNKKSMKSSGKRGGRHSHRLVLNTTPRMERYLDSLLETGLYGTTREETAARLMVRGIETAIERGMIDHIPIAEAGLPNG